MPQSFGVLEGTEGKKLIPLYDNVVVRPIGTPAIKGGILIPESAKDRAPISGIVLSLGDELVDAQGKSVVPFEEGDRVMFSKYAGYEVIFDGGERILCLKSADILMLIADDVKLENDSQTR